MEVRQRVTGIVTEDGWALVKLAKVPDRPGIAARVFSTIACAEISVDLILQNASVDRMADISFTVRHGDVDGTVRCLARIRDEVDGATVEVIGGLAKVELVGTGIVSDPSCVGGLFQTLATVGVNVIAIGTSEIRISCLIAHKDQKKASEALSGAFRIGER